MMKIKYPVMLRLRQRMNQPTVTDLDGLIGRGLSSNDLPSASSGSRVAVAVGSRGIANLPTIVRSVVRYLRSEGAEPFIVTAMGSHGGANTEGQIALLDAYGITEESVGAPIRAGMSTCLLGHTSWGMPVWVDEEACAAEATVLINRIKPHTVLTGKWESGLMKMMVVGLGNEQGAAAFHVEIFNRPLNSILGEAGRLVLSKLPVLFGVALLENADEQTAKIEVIPGQRIPHRGAALLREARALIGSIPLDFVHLLIVDELGKDISGTGMDPNVIGRRYYRGTRSPKRPDCARIIVRDLTEHSGGNANGVGLADYITRRLYEKIDFEVTKINAIVAASPESCRLPVVLETDREAIEAGLRTCGIREPAKARVVRIRNTLMLTEMWVSASLRSELDRRKDIEIVSNPQEMQFAPDGSLLSEPWS